MLDAFRNVAGVFWEFIEAIVFALAIFVVVYLFLFQPNQVKGSSMYPTFKDGEYILTDKISYKLGVPARGDVVVFVSPKNNNIDFIKRIIAVPGDTVKISGGKTYLNGELLDEAEYLDPSVYTGAQAYLSENTEVVVPDGRYFVMGDNRPNSSDSRDFGPVTVDEFRGKVFFRYWPVDRFGKIDSAKYLGVEAESANP